MEDVPRELVGVEEPLPAAEAEEEQQRDEREKSLGAVSPAPPSARRASRRSGSQSPGVRSLSPLVCPLMLLSASHAASDSPLVS